MNDSNRILITGASGFIGSALLEAVREKDFIVRGAVRRLESDKQINDILVEVGDLEKGGRWNEALKDVQCIIHLAGCAHVTCKKKKEQIETFRKVNVTETIKLAEQAARTGVKRFIFISSIGVNGNRNNKPFVETDIPAPIEPYAISKLEAEQALTTISIKTGMELVIIRPPLVYGPGVPGNFRKLIKLISLGIPLPLGLINNKRSFLALDNLVDFIITCIRHPKAANQVFLLSDGNDLSTTQLVMKLTAALGKSTKIIPVPERILEWCLISIGKREIARQLCGSLQVDNSKAKKLLGWVPPASMDTQLNETAKAYLNGLR